MLVVKGLVMWFLYHCHICGLFGAKSLKKHIDIRGNPFAHKKATGSLNNGTNNRHCTENVTNRRHCREHFTYCNK